MFINKETKKRVNHLAPYTDEEGNRWPKYPMELLEEIPEPTPPEDFNPEFYYVTNQDDAPYVIYTKKSEEQIFQILQTKYETALDNYLDSEAKKFRYNDRFSFALRAGYPGPWQAEGIAFARWMDTVNLQAYVLLEKVMNKEVEVPTVEDFIASLPVFEVPSENA